MKTQLLGVLKPDGTLRRAAGAGILEGLRNSKLCEFLTFRQVEVPTELIEQHYAHVSSRNFYPWLVRYMSSGPSYVVLLESNVDDIQKIRDLLGATRAHQAQAGTLRYEYAPYGGANCFHLSDSLEAANAEVPLWAARFNLEIGQFDQSIDNYIEQYIGGPNNTQALRELCSRIAEKGRPVNQEDEDQLLKLISAECLNATQDEVDKVVWTIREGCFF